MSTTERPREIWTRLTVDPLADPLARRLHSRAWVTPDRITAIALLLGVAAAACFAAGQLRWGGALFILRFFADCLDGKVARLQGSSSARGALFDITADVLGVTAAYAALSWRMTYDGHLGTAPALLLLALVVLYNWALSHRKHLAETAGLGSGGFDHSWRPAIPVLSSWVALCRRWGMSLVPWAVEAEILALGLAPLFGPPDLVAAALIIAIVFYLLADLVNLRRLWRIASRLDARSHRPTPGGP